jgi:hypothetical protein
MPSSTNVTQSYHSIALANVLHPRWLVSNSSQENPTQLISSANIGVILRFGHISKHYSSGWEVMVTLKIERRKHFKQMESVRI